jgi:hypothetical protein
VIEWSGTVVESARTDLATAACTMRIAVTQFGTLPPTLRCGGVDLALIKGKLRLHEWVGRISATPGSPDAGSRGDPDLLYHIEIYDVLMVDEVAFQSGTDQVLETPEGSVKIRLDRFGHRSDDHPRLPIHGPAIYDTTPLTRDLVVRKTAAALRLPVGTRCTLATRLVRFASDQGFCVTELACGKRTLYGVPGSVALGVNATRASWAPCSIDERTGSPLDLRDDQVTKTDGDPLLVGALDGEAMRYSEIGDLESPQVELGIVKPEP